MDKKNPATVLSEIDLLTLELDLIDLSARGKWWKPPKSCCTAPNMDAAKYEEWDSNRRIPADVIRRLVVGGGELCPWPTGTEPLLVQGAIISGELKLQGVTLKRGLWLEHCAFDELVQLSDSTTSSVSFRGSYLAKGLRAKRATIKGSLYLNEGLVAADEVNFEDITIEGNLECSGGKFNNKTHAHEKSALIADNAKIGGDVRLNLNTNSDVIANREMKFEAWGEVRFAGAKVEGDFDCTGGVFHGCGESAIDGGGMSCRNLFLQDGFEAWGAVQLVGATLAHDFVCDGGSFHGYGKSALEGAGASCRNLYLRYGFVAEGLVSLVGVRTQGQLSCVGGTFQNKEGPALILRFAEISSALLFSRSKIDREENWRHAKIEGQLDLSQAKCRTFRDSKDAWPNPGGLLLDGFVYERFHDCATDSKTRQEWLQLQDSGGAKGFFCPQPWTQAVKVLRDMGHDAEAQELAYQRESARLRSGTVVGIWPRILHATVGSGYKPFRPLYISAAFFLIGWLTFACAANLGFMAPRETSVQTYLAEDSTRHLPKDYTRFNAPLYALDVFLPIVELGQDRAWEPSDIQSGHRRITHDDLRTEGIRQDLGHDRRVTGGPLNAGAGDIGLTDLFAKLAILGFSLGLHRFVYWSMEILGWIFVSLFITGMSGIMKKE